MFNPVHVYIVEHVYVQCLQPISMVRIAGYLTWNLLSRYHSSKGRSTRVGIGEAINVIATDRFWFFLIPRGKGGQKLAEGTKGRQTYLTLYARAALPILSVSCCLEVWDRVTSSFQFFHVPCTLALCMECSSPLRHVKNSRKKMLAQGRHLQPPRGLCYHLRSTGIS